MPVSSADIPVTCDRDIPVGSPFEHWTGPEARRRREAAPYARLWYRENRRNI